MSEKAYAYFWVSGFDSADEITRCLAIEPTDSWQAGDLMPHRARRLRYKKNRWCHRTDTKPTPEEALSGLLEHLRPLAGLPAVVGRYETGVTVVWFTHRTNPELVLSREQTASLSMLGEFWLDLYRLPCDDDS